MFAGVVGDHVLPPVFLESAVDAVRFWEMLQNEVMDFVGNFPMH